MLPVERQKRIEELIQKKQNLKISDLSRELGVSEMTVHRDLKPLVERGLVMKTFGGVTLVRLQREEPVKNDECVYCYRKVDERLAYRLILPRNKVEVACCPHCGLLRHKQLEGQEVQAICYDFLRHTTISAPLAWFVLGTSLNVGCCQPQVLTFEHEEHARQFAKGFGGDILSFQEAIEQLPHMMKETQAPHCHHHHG